LKTSKQKDINYKKIPKILRFSILNAPMMLLKFCIFFSSGKGVGKLTI